MGTAGGLAAERCRRRRMGELDAGMLGLGLLGKLFLKMIGGTRNERINRARMRFVREQINPLEEALRRLSDAELRTRSDELRRRRAEGASRDSIMAEAFALVRESCRRARLDWERGRALPVGVLAPRHWETVAPGGELQDLNVHRQFDVQLAAGMILDEGWVAEEATGEGKTIACYPAVYMAHLDGMHTHVVTVNDYLVARDALSAAQAFGRLGVTVGYITAEMESAERKPQYACDVTYGTNSEFGFDYLRDNMKLSVEEQVQGRLDFAIVDEVDSILIDEARTPLIISGPAYGQTDLYKKANQVTKSLVEAERKRKAREPHTHEQIPSLEQELEQLEQRLAEAGRDAQGALEDQREQVGTRLREARRRLEPYYELQLDKKSAYLTHEGVTVAQDIAGVGSFYVGANMDWPHLMEQSLKAHLVYKRDKDYVVQAGRVIIVDEFTGRLLEGREWSDGLHQAVEAKEHVAIKEENQTLATITIQNYFKMYRKLAGMTGTAMTEAAELMKIYGLDVVAIPTHRPVNRVDHNDRIYADDEAKYRALVEEINAVSKSGRPVLVGTTSVEKSELLSDMLQKKYGVVHHVLNARPENADKEAYIVSQAGRQHDLKKGSKKMVGNVTIATNMAGRGTDIKLGPGVVYDKCRVPSAEGLNEYARAGLIDEADIPVLLSHIEGDDLFPPGVNKCCLYCEQCDLATNCAHCFKPRIDPDFPLRGRMECRQEVPCGLHIVGTERHEARRIDNQLRGRSGRQGDPGSSRFFLSLHDDLISIFAGDWMRKVLGWLGLTGDVAIEDRRVSRGIARAQRKVEERNFDIRKNLLEYDEVMDYQRREFYSRRQQILEGRGLEGLVREMIGTSVAEAAEDYLAGRYPQRCIAEWARQELQIPVQDEQIRVESLEELGGLEADLRSMAKEEAANNISMTLGEYMDQDVDRREWDLGGLSSWAMSRFGVNLPQNQLRKMQPHEVEQALTAAAFERIDKTNLSGAKEFLQPDFAEASLADWASAKFNVRVRPEDLKGELELVTRRLQEMVEQAYRRREIEYPVEYALERTIGQAEGENVYALSSLADWANRKFDAGLSVDRLRQMSPEEIRSELIELSQAWSDGERLEGLIRGALGSEPSVDAAIEFARHRFDTELQAEDFDGDVPGKLLQVGRSFLRREMTELERSVLLQIYDSSWKDHLLAMDHLKSGIGLRGYAEQDPRVAYKREGARLFQEMIGGVRDKITDMIFKARLTAGAEIASVYEIASLVHEQLQGYDHLARDMADQQAAAAPRKVETIVREAPKIGRNAPCPCGSGKKYKKCCGRNV